MGEPEKERADQPQADSTEKEAAPTEKAVTSAAKKRARKSKEVRIAEMELKELKEKASRADEYWDRLLRLQADFENFRKRKEKERLDLIKYATEAFVCELVPILDNFETALLAAEDVPQVKGFVEGIELILKELKKILKDHGVEEICPLGVPFDPYRHEALEKVHTDEHPEGHVLQVLRTGYALNDRVIQPAAVKVAASPKVDQNGVSATGAEDETGENDEPENKTSQDTAQEGRVNE